MILGRASKWLVDAIFTAPVVPAGNNNTCTHRTGRDHGLVQSLVCPKYYPPREAAANLNHWPVIVFDKCALGKGVLHYSYQSNQIYTVALQVGGVFSGTVI